MYAIKIKAKVNEIVNKNLDGVRYFHGMQIFHTFAYNEPNLGGESIMAQVFDSTMDRDRDSNEHSGVIAEVFEHLEEVLDSANGKHLIKYGFPCLNFPNPLRVVGKMGVALYAANTDADCGVILWVS